MRSFIKRLRNAYGLKNCDDEIQEFLFSKCGNIPSRALDWIEERFQVTYEKFPTKLHGALTSCWWDYLREHPEQRAHIERKECPYCQDGMLRLTKFEKMHGRMTEYSANCGHCRQRQDERLVPMMTHDQARAKGFTVLGDDGKEYAKSGASTWNAVAAMAAGGRVPNDERRADLR
jgi:hypothetical protein